MGICPSVVDSDELRMLNWCQIGMHEAAFLLYWRACHAPTQFGGGVIVGLVAELGFGLLGHVMSIFE